jgi:hypothetical protein
MVSDWNCSQRLCRRADLLRACESRYGYTLGLHVLERAEMNPAGSDTLDTVPIALDCGIQAKPVADAVHCAVYICEDSDTTASMAAAIAEACFGLEGEMVEATLARMPAEMHPVIDALYARAQDEQHPEAAQRSRVRWLSRTRALITCR